MALLHIPLAQIDEKQLLRLIEARTAEARDIEYKRDTYGDRDEDRAEWLADISSFANAAGGDLIIGMAATKGVPQSLAPLSLDPDAEILRLGEIARANLQPRISNLDFKAVPLTGGGHAIVVRIPRSYNPPHRVVRAGKGQNRFWARSSAGKYEPNVDELRALFTAAPQLLERMRDFRADRAAQIVAGQAPVELLDAACLIMHIVPFESFDSRTLIDLAAIENNSRSFPPMGASGAQNWIINFDGILLKSNAQEKATHQRAYTQVFRSGMVEAVVSSIASGERPDGVGPRLTAIKLEGSLIKYGIIYLKSLHALGIEPPYVFLASLVGVKGVGINVGITPHWHTEDDISTLGREQYHFAEVIIESVPNSIQDFGRMIRPLVEQIANTAGRANSTSYGPSGEYLHLFQ